MPGRATITPSAQKRLENLAKALIDRPALKLEIEGRIDPGERSGRA
jgi:outer membrane protein OmpA-like peptidoglycan-associated protein